MRQRNYMIIIKSAQKSCKWAINGKQRKRKKHSAFARHKVGIVLVLENRQSADSY